MSWQANHIKSLSEFSNSSKILEIGSGNFKTLINLARIFPNKDFYGLDFVFSKEALSQFEEMPPNLTVIKHDAKDLNLFNSDFFDFIFFIAVVEHIQELQLHLNELYRVLQSNCTYYFWAGPFWSCSLGHHYYHWLPTCPIPHYSHLYTDRNALKRLLSQKNMRHEEVKNIIHRVYDRNDLSRLSRTQTRLIVEQSKFKLASWDDVIDENFSEQLANLVLKNNIYDISKEDLLFKGARVTLRATDKTSDARIKSCEQGALSSLG